MCGRGGRSGRGGGWGAGARGACRTALPTHRRTQARTVPGLAGGGAPHWALFALDGHHIQVEREEVPAVPPPPSPPPRVCLSTSLHRNAAIHPRRRGKKGGGGGGAEIEVTRPATAARGSRGRGGFGGGAGGGGAYRDRMRGLWAGLTGHPTRSPPPLTTSVRRDKKNSHVFPCAVMAT